VETLVAWIIPAPLGVIEHPVPQIKEEEVLVPPSKVAHDPDPLTNARGGTGTRAAVIFIAFPAHAAGVLVPQLIAVVTVNVCGPLPIGARTPGEIETINRHVVLDGRITPLSPRRIVKVPLGLRSPEIDVAVKETPFNVGAAPPAVISCAEIVPPPHGIPFGSIIVPLTVVKPFCAKAGEENIRKIKMERTVLYDGISLDYLSLCNLERLSLRYSLQ
jgi:hypothetical protein